MFDISEYHNDMLFLCFLRHVKVTRTLPFIMNQTTTSASATLNGGKIKASCLSSTRMLSNSSRLVSAPFKPLSSLDTLSLDRTRLCLKGVLQGCGVMLQNFLTAKWLGAVFLRKVQIHRMNRSISTLNNKAALPLRLLFKTSWNKAWRKKVASLLKATD